MKHLLRAIGLIILTAGAAYPMSSLPPPSDSEEAAQYIDTALFWREASGPHGERNTAALPLYEAVFAHDHRRVASLLDHGALPNALLYPHRWSPLMVAVVYNDHQTARLLVNHGADVNYVSNDPANGTPLGAALSYGRFYTIENPDFSMFHYLLNAGADVNLEYNNSDIAIDAATMGRMDIVNELLMRGFRHDLPGLKKWLEHRAVYDKIRPDRDKALATINRLLTR
jgi:hypothetical protein